MQERGLLQPAQLEAVRQGGCTSTGGGGPADVWDALIATGELDELALARMLAQEAGLEFSPAPEGGSDVRDAIPAALARRREILPLGRDGVRLRVAVADPFDLSLCDSLPEVVGQEVVLVVAPRSSLRQAIARHYRDDAIRGEVSAEDSADGAVTTAAPVGVSEDEAPLVQLVQSLLVAAVRRRASDIHLEPRGPELRVRHRIDGVLVPAEPLPRQLQAAVISRLKILANISIAEKRLPQDGRIQIVLDGRELDLRVSSMPTVHGESLVLRLLDQRQLPPGLAELGMWPDDEQDMRRLLAAPDGMLLVTGPTGAGKTTTLYGCLQHLNRRDRKVITVEDPVEYQIAGINQVPVRPAVGMTFAAALRAMLRQAPNVVMVGEIRDRETADIALNAAMTGHLVLSTLHTNDAVGAVMRLGDLGAKPFLVCAALRAAVAQRLVRRVCPACRRRHEPTPRDWQALGLTASQAAAGEFVRGAGCARCQGTGYLGRTALVEVLSLSAEMRELIHAGVGAPELRACARRQGMRSLRADGVRKVLAGLTTIEEVAAVTTPDRD